MTPPPYNRQKPSQKNPKNKNNFPRFTTQEPVFPVSDTEFEGGGDGRGCGDCFFWVKHG
jgi:hypothetical protein